MAKDLQFGEELVAIQEKWTEIPFEEEPLDGDEVDKLSWVIKIQLNFMNGNITEDEKQAMLDFNSEKEYYDSIS